MKHILVEIEVSDEFAKSAPGLIAADITAALRARDDMFNKDNVEGADATEAYYGKARVLTEDKPL